MPASASAAPDDARARVDPDERALVAACVAGDADAWGRLHTRFRPVVLRVARDCCARAGAPDPAVFAEDVASDVFAMLLADERRALARFEGRSSFATWLTVLARRRAGRALDRVRRGAARSLDTESGDALPVAAPTGEATAEVDETRARLREHLDQLGPRDRLALLLFYEGDRSYKHVAATLDVPVARVGTLLARARARLARLLGRDDPPA